MASPVLLDRLGLDRSLSLGELASTPWSVVGSTEPLDARIARGEADPSTFEPLAWDDEASPGLSFARSTKHPELILVEGADVRSAMALGQARRVGADALVFVALEGSALRVGARLLSVEGARLSLDALAHVEVEAQELRPDVNSSLLTSLSVLPYASPLEPRLLAALSPLAPAEWLVAEAIAIAERGGEHSFAAALGLVARLYTEHDDVLTGRAEMFDGQRRLPSPRSALVRSWGDGSKAESVEVSALQECARCRASLDALSSAVDHDHPALRAMALRWVLLRDDLEAARFALSVIDRDHALRHALDALDRQAGTLGTLWSALGPFSERRRLAEVAWQEPHLWWSALGV
jgi:hypothetical protein